MHFFFTTRKLSLPMFARVVVATLIVGALTSMPAQLPFQAGTASAASLPNPPACFQPAPNLGTLINNVVVCWNGFTGEFELYFSPTTGIVSSGVCGTGGVTQPPPWPTGVINVYRPTGLLWEIHIVPDLNNLPLDITLTYTVRGYKKGATITPYEFQYTRGFSPSAVMASPSHCLQLFP